MNIYLAAIFNHLLLSLGCLLRLSVRQDSREPPFKSYCSLSGRFLLGLLKSADHPLAGLLKLLRHSRHLIKASEVVNRSAPALAEGAHLFTGLLRDSKLTSAMVNLAFHSVKSFHFEQFFRVGGLLGCRNFVLVDARHQVHCSGRAYFSGRFSHHAHSLHPKNKKST